MLLVCSYVKYNFMPFYFFYIHTYTHSYYSSCCRSIPATEVEIFTAAENKGNCPHQGDGSSGIHLQPQGRFFWCTLASGPNPNPLPEGEGIKRRERECALAYRLAAKADIIFSMAVKAGAGAVTVKAAE